MIEGLVDHQLLRALTASERRSVLELCRPAAYPSGARLTRRGASATGLHLLLEGTVLVTIWVDDQPHDVAVLGPDTWVGEVSLLASADGVATGGGKSSGGVSSADVRAETDVRAAVVPPGQGAQLLAIDAVHLQLEALARRRAATNRALRTPPMRAGTMDDRELELRPLWPEDWRQLAAGAGAGRVSDESLRKRFFSLPQLTERTFRRFTSTNHVDQFAWGAFLDGQIAGVGRHALQSEDRSIAELAVLVADELHGRGLGTLLVSAVAAAATAHGALELHALARTDNDAVQGLLAGFGASWSWSDDPGTVEATWPVADALAAAPDQSIADRALMVAIEVLGDVATG